MKKLLLLLITLVLSNLLIQAQDCKDVVYPTKGRSVIFNCCIDEVNNGNRVLFTKDGITESIEAISIIKDGQTLNLISLNSDTLSNAVYRGHNYRYYDEKYRQATIKKNVGMIISAIGLVEAIAGALLIESGNEPFPQILIFAGAVAFSVGIPIAISGGVEASNNLKAREMSKLNASLTFGTTPHGLGLVLHF